MEFQRQLVPGNGVLKCFVHFMKLPYKVAIVENSCDNKHRFMVSRCFAE